MEKKGAFFANYINSEMQLNLVRLLKCDDFTLHNSNIISKIYLILNIKLIHRR